jgi:hypothetical protein
MHEASCGRIIFKYYELLISQCLQRQHAGGILRQREAGHYEFINY